MRGLRKRIIALAAVAAMVMTSFVGCGSIDNSKVVATVGDSEITLGMANFFARYQQPSFEEYYVSYQDYYQQQMYGSVISETVMDWSAEQEEGVTLEDGYKDDIMKTLQQWYILEDHMDEYGVEITEDESKAINKAAKAFVKANSDDVNENISADKETVAELLKLMTISTKMQAAIKDATEVTVKDDEVAQKRLRYVSFSKSTTTEEGETVELSKDEIKALKKEAQAFRKAAKTNGSIEAYATEQGASSSTVTYGADYADDTSATLPTEVYDAAEKLEEGGFAKVIDTDSAYYVIQLESMLDEEATETKKESVIEERKSEALTETIEKWTDDTKIKVYDKVWDKVRMRDIQINKKAEETEESTDGTSTTIQDVEADDMTVEE